MQAVQTDLMSMKVTELEVEELETRPRRESKTGNKAWLRRRLHANVRAHLEERRTACPPLTRYAHRARRAPPGACHRARRRARRARRRARLTRRARHAHSARRARHTRHARSACEPRDVRTFGRKMRAKSRTSGH